MLMIASFGDRSTYDLFNGIASKQSRRIPMQIHQLALYKLDLLNAAKELNDLRAPPRNRLEALRGKLKGFYSVRINAQWRVVFRWTQNNAVEVRVMDYH